MRRREAGSLSEGYRGDFFGRRPNVVAVAVCQIREPSDGDSRANGDKCEMGAQNRVPRIRGQEVAHHLLKTAERRGCKELRRFKSRSRQQHNAT